MAVYRGKIVKTRRLDIGEWIEGGELVIQEPTRGEVGDLRAKRDNEEEVIEVVRKIAMDNVIDHNLENDSGGRVEKKEILDALFNYLSFIEEFIEAITDFFPSARKMN